jgi:hypothetical protein
MLCAIRRLGAWPSLRQASCCERPHQAAAEGGKVKLNKRTILLFDGHPCIIDAQKPLNVSCSLTLPGEPLFVVGDAGIGGVRGQRSSPASTFKQFLLARFLVVILDEFYTSKRCPSCLNSWMRYS